MLDTAPEVSIGDQLELLLDQLERAALKISPRDRMLAAALVAALVARGQARTFTELRPSLAPLLARSPQDRERFFQVFDLLVPRSFAPDPDLTSPIQPRPQLGARWLWPLAGFVVLLAIGLAAWWLWPSPVPKGPTELTASKERASIPAPQIQATALPPVTAIETLNRVATAAERFEGAPTIEELARELAKTSTIGWRAESYAVRLNELSGLPKTWPLALYGKDGKDGRIWAMLALALDRIERPGREPTFPELMTGANGALAQPNADPKLAYQVAEWLGGWLRGSTETDKSKLIEAIQDRYHTEVVKSDGRPKPGERLDEHTIQRALAIQKDLGRRQVFPDAPWLPRNPPSGVPRWMPWLAMLLPLALAVFWFSNSLTLRKAYLRRRPPELPPLHLDIVSEAATRVRFAAAMFQRVAQRLGLRTARVTDRLDLAGSIAATVAGGGEIPVAVYQTIRHAPEYLVLIEQRSAGDQDARRLRDLVHRLESLLPLTVFYYRTEPSRLEPERGGRSASIEQLQAQYPDHRLLVLGSGTEFLDPATLKPHSSVEKLTHWTQRALLTPIPLAEWGREEFALAHELRMPVGRATAGGLLALAELLGLEGSEFDTLLDTRGDGLARPLPEMLRVRPQRFLYNALPSDVPIERILRDLRNFLDGPGFEWLCGLAVYPAVQWDLTLYLGVGLPELGGGDPATAPLYREDRVAALTQLPWLREGMMPNWLRGALIAELPPARTAEIRTIIKRLIGIAQLSGDARRDDAIKLRIAQEVTRDRLPPKELLQDEVLLDFLARGRIEDFALPNGSWLERFLPRRWLDRIGLPELTAGLVAMAYTAAAFWLSPNADDGALVVGAWLPLVTLLVGALVVITASNLAVSYTAFRGFMLSSAAFWLAYPIFVTLSIGVMLAESRYQDGSTVNLPPGWYLIPLGFAALLAARGLAQLAGLPRRQTSVLRGVAATCGAVMVLIAILHVSDGILHAQDDGIFIPRAIDKLNTIAEIRIRHVLVGLALSLPSLVALMFVCFLPERLPPPKPVPRGTRPNHFRGALHASFALLPILPAAWLSAYVAGSSVALDSIPGGATAVAELPDGTLVALGGADGKVRIYDINGSRKPLTVIETGSAAISSLALRRDREGDPASPIALAASTADGRIHLFDARGGSKRPLPPTMADLVGEASKVHIALGEGAHLVAAFESGAGLVRLISSGGIVDIEDAGPVTAFAPAGGRTIGIATLDGRVRVATTRDGYPAAFAVGEPLQLLGRARLLAFDKLDANLAVVSEDGALVRISLANDQISLPPLSSEKMRRLGLGASQIWRRQGQEPVFASPEDALQRGLEAYRRGRYEAAVPALTYAANRNNLMAQFYLARIYADKSASFVNDAKAYQLFAGIASDYADIDPEDKRAPFVSKSLMAVARYLMTGLPQIGLRADSKRAEDFLHHAATFFGDKDAQFELAKLNLADKSAGADPRRGLHYLSVLSQEGHAGAQAFLADLYFRGRFVTRDAGRALALAVLAIEAAQPEDWIWIEDIYQNVWCGTPSAARQRQDKASPWMQPPPRSTTGVTRTCADGTVVPLSPVRQPVPSNDPEIIPSSESSRSLVPTSPGEAGTTFRDCPTCPEMIVMPAGIFIMGSSDSEEGRQGNEAPQHRVSFARPFAVGRYPVTFEEWDACLAGGGCNGYRPGDQGWGRGRLPVINVSWNDAKAYIAWISRGTGEAYRLLSESEREYVTRAGSTSPFWSGSTISPQRANYNSAATNAKDGRGGNYRQRTVPVDSFQQNPFGLFNVHGNVWEWVEDCYSDSYVGGPVDGSARIDGNCNSRLLRGGAWDSKPQNLRSAQRNSDQITSRKNNLGFRLARTINP